MCNRSAHSGTARCSTVQHKNEPYRSTAQYAGSEKCVSRVFISEDDPNLHLKQLQTIHFVTSGSLFSCHEQSMFPTLCRSVACRCPWHTPTARKPARIPSTSAPTLSNAIIHDVHVAPLFPCLHSHSLDDAFRSADTRTLCADLSPCSTIFNTI